MSNLYAEANMGHDVIRSSTYSGDMPHGAFHRQLFRKLLEEADYHALARGDLPLCCDTCVETHQPGSSEL